MSTSSFSQFTNLYSLSKTLRFELKPVGKTQEMLEKNKVFQNDQIIQEKYEKTKPYIDKLHREFVKESLENTTLKRLGEYHQALKNIKKKTKETNNKKENKLKKEFKNLEKDLRKQIIDQFEQKAKEWSEKYLGLKKKNLEIFNEENIFEHLLKVKYGQEDDAFIKNKKGEFILDEADQKISIFDSWKGFTGYFSKFFETRKNFYKADGTSTAIATRIINQNLKRFCENILIFEKIKNKLDSSEFEKNFNKKLTEIFTLNFYNNCLLQNDINFYNKILGGETLENGEKIKGINEIINKYRQDNKGEKIPFLKTLDKQILGETEKNNFIDEIKNDNDLKEELIKFQEKSEEKINLIKTLLLDFIKNNEKYDLSKIYISKKGFNTISQKWAAETNLFQHALHEEMKKSKKFKASYNKKEDCYKFPEFIPLSFIEKSLNKIESKTFWKDKYNEINNFKNQLKFNQFLKILEFEFLSLFEKEIVDKNTKVSKKNGYDISYLKFSELLNKFENTDKSKSLIKEFVDSVLHIYQLAKYFSIEKKRFWLDSYELGSFYTNPYFGYKLYYDNAYESIIQAYNKIRNYLTKKPYNQEKWKLNFENPTLANGWDKNKEIANFAVILRKEKKYYLGLMKKGSNKIFNDKFIEQTNCKNEKYEKMIYKLLPGASKMLPKVFFSKKNIDYYNPSEEILEIRNRSSYTKDGSPQKKFTKKEFSLNDCHKMIDFFKSSLNKHNEWKNFHFKFSNTSEYKDISSFYREVESQGYKIIFQDISEFYINEKNNNEELYLFEIHNKDWNEGSSGRKNLHTMYFESLFSEENLAQNFSSKLNGQAEIFYRPKTNEKKLGLRKDKNGKEILKHKRYSKNKIFFHVPITLNRTQSNTFNFNKKINKFLANNKNINIIGIDRGEKHLAYYSVINQNQKILESGTLNKVTSNECEIDYHKKLEKRADDREKEKQDWQSVEEIKNLKKGYISQVVRKIADLAIKYNAIIIFEDLNMRFKQIRGGIEKSIYQQLEKALIDKLNFLVNKKEINPKKAGYLLKAYQLTAPFKTFQEMGKQTGILFYTQASYTSKIDPITGWRPNLYLKYTNAKKAKEDILKLSKVEFKDSYFEFTYDIKNFKNLNNPPQNTIWKICSCVERFKWKRNLNNNKGGYDHYENLTNKFIELFSQLSIDINQDILTQIKSINPEIKENKKIFKDFIYFFNLICQIRNTNPDVKDDENDFILSPAYPFFDSRKNNDDNLPKNGDDNGAFNIARKGILILKKINQWSDDNEKLKLENKKELKFPDLYISSNDWDNFVRKN